MIVNKLGHDWLQIKAWAEDRIASSLSSLELTSENGDNHRGQLAVLRALIEAVEPPPKPELEDENYG